MTTRAEMAAETDHLRARVTAREAQNKTGNQTGNETGGQATDQPATEPETPPAPEHDWHQTLAAFGIGETDAKALFEQFTKELGDLPRTKPLLTVVAAFGLGFVLGRASKGAHHHKGDRT